jgi:hypothetical protein
MFKTEEQLSISTSIDDGEGDPPQLQRYAIVDIEQVWREERKDD